MNPKKSAGTKRREPLPRKPKAKRFCWTTDLMNAAVQAVAGGSMSQRQACEEFKNTLFLAQHCRRFWRARHARKPWLKRKIQKIRVVLVLETWTFDNDDLEGDFTSSSCFAWNLLGLFSCLVLWALLYFHFDHMSFICDVSTCFGESWTWLWIVTAGLLAAQLGVGHLTIIIFSFGCITVILYWMIDCW